MNIIFGDEIETLAQRNILLELDTFVCPDGQKRTAYCLVENIPTEDFPILDSYVKAHHDMMEAYRKQDWDYCRHAIQGLWGKWSGELDSFYHDLAQRVEDLVIKPPELTWDGSRTLIIGEENGNQSQQ